jgi:hypothetical protein
MPGNISKEQNDSFTFQYAQKKKPTKTKQKTTTTKQNTFNITCLAMHINKTIPSTEANNTKATQR